MIFPHHSNIGCFVDIPLHVKEIIESMIDELGFLSFALHVVKDWKNIFSPP